MGPPPRRSMAAPGIPPSSARFAYYVRGYNVIEKIQTAKASDTFEQLVSAPPPALPARLAAAYGLPPGITWKRVPSGSR